MKNDFFVLDEKYGADVVDVEYQEVKPRNIVDSTRVILLVLVIDCSDSMVKILPRMPVFLEDFIKQIKEDSELRDEAELLLVKYGTNCEVGDFSPINYFNIPNNFTCMGLTDTAKALRNVHEKIKERIHFYHSEVLRELPTPIILHISDGMATSGEDRMNEMAALFDEFKRKNGSRRIKMWSASPIDKVCNEMKRYSDITFKMDDILSISDMLKTYVSLASSLSNSTLTVDPVTGEENFYIENDITLPDTIEKCIPRDLING